ncbi:MAG: hypothetical protein HQK60_08605 [Deltaproteobacteria bacterium]|nr:hypothetical protein [Deltaproteobacteria bacterium]
MRSTLDAFLTDIGKLRKFVESTGRVYRILAGHEDASVRACLSIRRGLDYIAFIIALYAAFEKYVEELVWSYTELESTRRKYSELCDRLRTKHLKQSADLLNRGRLGEGRYTGVSEIDIVENLNGCLTGKNPYKLNRHAVIHHDLNLRSNVVQEVFGALGIKNINAQACRVEEMRYWFSISKGHESSSDEKVMSRVLELWLENLVDRRNQVAHGGFDVAESLDTNEMQARLNFLEAYARSLFIVIKGAYLDYYIESGLAMSLGRPIGGPFENGSVVVVSKPACSVFVGQPIIGVRKGRVVQWGEVLEIKVQDVRVESVDPDFSTNDVGLRTNFKMTKGFELYVLGNKDEMI